MVLVWFTGNIFLGEKILPNMMIGAALIIFGITLSKLGYKTRPEVGTKLIFSL